MQLVWYEAAGIHTAGSSTGYDQIEVEELLKGEGSDADRLDAVAAVIFAFVKLEETDTEEVFDGWNNESYLPHYDVDELVSYVNDTLLGARVQWHYVDGQFVERGNSILHSEIVEPVSVLLDSSPRFALSSDGFNKAINRLSANEPDVAITEVSSAVQDFFRALGVDKGNSVTSQLEKAVQEKIIAPEDRELLKAVAGWINADRSNRGNAHHNRSDITSRADAWLMIHIAGAFMVRLSNEEPRNIEAVRKLRLRNEQEKISERASRAIQVAKDESAVKDPKSQDDWGSVPPF
ncbi:hypothetical protein GM708_07505 [Vibrio cholerae]|nr:hypothetical protein [Vibrio cholerae]